jgi:hypothetical protein
MAADYSPEDAENARRIVERLLSRDIEGFDFAPHVALSDVESDARQFSDELDVVNRFGVGFPAVTIEDDKVPVSFGWVTALAPASFFRTTFSRLPPFYADLLYGSLRFQLESVEYPIMTISSEQARETFVKRAAQFVATRIGGVRNLREPQSGSMFPALRLRRSIRGPQVVTPGCNFTITTNSNGLRVFWSGAYYVTPNNFNHPTSPTSSVLQSGTYIFGVDGGAYGNNIQWDLNCVVSLPGVPHAHLNY